MAAESVIVLAQDTTTLSYNTLHQTRGLGPIGDKRHCGRGLLLHSMQAFRTDRIPLGCAWARVWARAENSDTAQRNEQSVAEKESGRWIDAYQAAVGLAHSMPRTMSLAIPIARRAPPYWNAGIRCSRTCAGWKRAR